MTPYGYDSIQGNCPKCGKFAEYQTKLLKRELTVYKVGDALPLPEELRSATIELKHPCYGCKSALMIVVEAGVLKAVAVLKDPDYIEQPFGEFEKREKK
jgi:hypothetical protein